MPIPPLPKSADLPDWVEWLAQDADGSWWGFEAEPHLADSSWYENEVGRIVRLKAGEPNAQWRESLCRKPTHT